MRTGAHSGCAGAMQASTSMGTRTALAGRPLASPAQPKRASRGQLQVVAVKGQGKKRAQQQGAMGATTMRPPTPEVDPDNVEFVVFIRADKLPQWYPLSIVKAGAAANSLVAGLGSEWGKKLYGKTLVRNIAKSIYRDKRQIEQQFRAQAPGMQKFDKFEYAFKIRDKSTPKDWMNAEHLTILPAEKDLGSSFLEDLGARFRGDGK